MPSFARTCPNVARGLEYVESVVEGRTAACTWVRLACERQIHDLGRFQAKDAPFYFDEPAAERVCDVVQRFPHIHGQWAKSQLRITLEPWQCFILMCVFGWKARATEARRFRVAYIEVPRKNAKALALNTPVPTPEGWTTIGEIQPGDQVFDGRGRVTAVTATSEVFNDHDCFELSFSNGEHIVADAGHLWSTTARVDAPGRQTRAGMKHGTSVITRIRTTAELFATQAYGGRNDRNHSV